MAVVKVAAGAISSNDVNNVEGKMGHMTLPRVPGRDVGERVEQFNNPAAFQSDDLLS